jgi:serine/threonine-protein kinase
MPETRRPHRVWNSAFAFAALLLASQPRTALAEEGAPEMAAPSDVQLAEQRAAQAYDAYQKKDYTTAVALYLEAFKAAPSADLLYNIARIYDAKLGDRQLAITFYRRYVADPGAVAERIKRANDRLVELRDAEIAAGDRVTREPRPAPAREPTSRSSALPAVGVALGVAGVVGLAVGTGFGLAARSKSDSAKPFCNGGACTSQRGVDDLHDASNSATVSTVAFVAGGALLAGGIALYLWGGNRKQGERETTALQVGAVATSSQCALEVAGSW